jgi:hypothetical protein
MFRRVLGGLKSGTRRFFLILIVSLISLAVVYRLETVPKAINHNEKQYVQSSGTLKQVYDEPANAPHKLLILGASTIIKPKVNYLRGVSILFAILSALSFYVLCRHWFGTVIALMSCLVFLISPFFLASARAVSPEILRFAPLIVLAVYYWHLRIKNGNLAWILLLLISATALYVPGMIWWVIGAVIFSRKQLLNTAGKISQTAAATGLLLSALTIVPLALAFVRNWRFLYQYLVIPHNLPAPMTFLKHLAWMITSLFFRTPYHDQMLIGRLPLLSVIQLALVVFGVYALYSAARKKAFWLSASVIMGVLLAALNNNLRLLFFSLPGLGIFMAAGLRYLYIEWRSVFPKNPIPKGLAIAMLAAVVTIQALYGLTYSLVAWPAAEPTKQVYVIK